MFYNKIRFEKLHLTVNKSDWTSMVPAAHINAYYDYTKNHIRKLRSIIDIVK